MSSLADPLKEGLSRPLRRFNPHADYMQTVRTAPTPSGGGSADRVFRLDIEISRVELAVHPLQ
eukprot:3705268-Pyramimonas_sp.AAC.1